MKAKVAAAPVGAVLMAALLVGCSETTPVQDVVSRTFTLKAADFDTRLKPGGQDAVATASYNMPEITEAIVAAGTVTAEVDLGSEGKEWSALPLTWYFTDRSDEQHVVAIQPSYKKGTFMLLMRASVESMIDGVLAINGHRLRAIVISGDAADG